MLSLRPILFDQKKIIKFNTDVTVGSDLILAETSTRLNASSSSSSSSCRLPFLSTVSAFFLSSPSLSVSVLSCLSAYLSVCIPPTPSLSFLR